MKNSSVIKLDKTIKNRESKIKIYPNYDIDLD